MAKIVDAAQSAGTFETLLKAVEAAGLKSTLTEDGPFTVFAPSDEAFERLPEGTLDSLLGDKSKLVSVLTYHVVAGRMLSTGLAERRSLVTLQGQPLSVENSDGAVKVGGAAVTQADIVADNGVIHVIDNVLLPS